MDQLTFLLEEPPASPSPSQAEAEAWMIRVATWPSSFVALLVASGPSGWYGRTSPESFQMEPQSGFVERPFDSSFQRFQTSGMAWHGECLTLSTSEWNHTLVPLRNRDDVCSLSDILETGDHLSRYVLSPKACAGIVRRAEKRGKNLPAHLEAALRQQAGLHPKSPAP